MTAQEMKKRTFDFALRVIKLVDSLPRKRSADVIGKQLIRSGTSVGANYRAACHAKSPADFVSKMGTVEEDADESGYWMELITAAGLMKPVQTGDLIQEANEIVAIAASSIDTTRKNAKLSRG